MTAQRSSANSHVVVYRSYDGDDADLDDVVGDVPAPVDVVDPCRICIAGR